MEQLGIGQQEGVVVTPDAAPVVAAAAGGSIDIRVTIAPNVVVREEGVVMVGVVGC